MKGFDTLKVKSAVKNHNEFNLSRAHLTTMNFGEIVPLFSEETVPGDKLNIDAHYFSRMAPLAKPTYGKFSFKTVAAFVPYHQIAWDAEAWLAGRTTWEGQTPHGRFISIGWLADFVRQYCCTSSGATSANTQFQVTQSNGTVTNYVFTKQGKYWVKILNALGYAVPQGVDYGTTSHWSTVTQYITLSAYPLLAFFKLYNDYMSQSQRYNTSILSSYLQSIKYGKQIAGGYFNPSTGVMSSALMKAMFDCLYLNYENDYFTSAWQTPNSPAGITEGITQFNVPSITRTDQVHWDNDHDGLQVNVNSGSPSTVEISQRALDFLKSFDDWVRRNNYSGSRAVQQVYSRFGIKTDDYRSHYANVISTDTIPVQVGDITSTAEIATGSTGIDATNILGSYAGKGIVSDGKSVSCQVSDYGLFIILGYFTVSPMNAFGFDRKVLRTDPLDYYNPEFDGLGADAIPLMEVYENPRYNVDSDTTNGDSVFGFTERYNSYRFGRDQITGEFRDFVNSNSSNAGMNVWHSGRYLSGIRAAGNLVAQSTSMNTLPQTDSEYNRIFAYTGGDYDHFYLTCQFGVKAVRPMLNLNQVPRLGEGDTVVPRNGNVIS